METKKRYTDEELEEFRTIVNDKLAIAKVWLRRDDEDSYEQEYKRR